MAYFFQFEADFVESLRCIPMVVRFKLDTCGVKLKLPQWHGFPASDRQQLVEQACETPAEIAAYRTTVQHYVQAHTGSVASELAIDPEPAWLEAEMIPASVQEKLQETDSSLLLEQWAYLSPLQRFVLIKLSRSNHENQNFVPALQEFGMAPLSSMLHQP